MAHSKKRLNSTQCQYTRDKVVAALIDLAKLLLEALLKCVLDHFQQ